MQRRFPSLLVVPFFIMANSAPAPAPTSVPAQDQSATDPSKKVVCKNELQTGSRFTTRKCDTVANWEAVSEAARRGAHEAFDRSGHFDQRGKMGECC